MSLTTILHAYYDWAPCDLKCRLAIAERAARLAHNRPELRMHHYHVMRLLAVDTWSCRSRCGL